MAGKQNRKTSEVYTVYILRTSGNTLYVGQTNDLDARLKTHKGKKGKGAKYLRMFDSFTLAYREELPSLSEALKREHVIKKLSKGDKEKLVAVRV